MCIVNAVKTIVKQVDVSDIHEGISIMIKSNEKILSFKNLSSKQLYLTLVNKDCVISKDQTKFALYFDISSDPEYWRSIYYLIT